MYRISVIVSEFPKDAQRVKLGFFLMLLLISLGSLLILFPAWLPDSSFNAVGEDGTVEFLQVVFLVLSGALFFATSSHTGHLRPIFIGMGLGALAAAIGEYRSTLKDLIAPVGLEWIQIPLFVVIGLLFLRNSKAFFRFWGFASNQPTTGFLLAALILAYVFGEVFGSSAFWVKSLGEGYDRQIPLIVNSYLELLACYFIFVSTLGFCLPITKRGVSKKQSANNE